MNHLIAPSLLAANFADLKTDLDMLNRSEADWLHLDIMDGMFVPNISFGLPVLQSLKGKVNKPFDVHLMIVQPDRYIADFKAAGADWLNVHYEACPHLHRTLQTIRQQGMKAGVTLNPHTPVSLLEEIITEADLVLLMSVNPGFGGQSFIENTYHKVEQLKELILKKNSQALIQVDGGVDNHTAPGLLKAGADVLVAGSYVFRSTDPIETIAQLKQLKC
ncbi:ribulose-phosphate 3-epimerase [Breznakibacter xylanolyticus]|uniref:Ribulose-phosphate 3-epimerase n=1 Tax=Breznakibacter xylanolyticus TaxID=990 RepID=A0A2W7MXS4_9BACT|nr:ribulose-phosphate 3-epimerase [Breznakibacter xylanolyticus]MBN2743890.1 ribulose-phosphate 3-epimerase [Marinilabiliaceae bacterium]PZX12343.1 ribulose-phosphate 3-epimerase [Breznakibacter xylanolyticus]